MGKLSGLLCFKLLTESDRISSRQNSKVGRPNMRKLCLCVGTHPPCQPQQCGCLTELVSTLFYWFVERFVFEQLKQQQVPEEEEERKTVVGASDASLTWSTSIFFMAALLVPPTTSLSRTLYQLPITGPFAVKQTKINHN